MWNTQELNDTPGDASRSASPGTLPSKPVHPVWACKHPGAHLQPPAPSRHGWRRWPHRALASLLRMHRRSAGVTTRRRRLCGAFRWWFLCAGIWLPGLFQLAQGGKARDGVSAGPAPGRGRRRRDRKTLGLWGPGWPWLSCCPFHAKDARSSHRILVMSCYFFQSTLIFACLISLSHLTSSALTIRPSASGAPPTASLPCPSNLSFISGSPTT